MSTIRQERFKSWLIQLVHHCIHGLLMQERLTCVMWLCSAFYGKSMFRILFFIACFLSEWSSSVFMLVYSMWSLREVYINNLYHSNNIIFTFTLCFVPTVLSVSVSMCTLWGHSSNKVHQHLEMFSLCPVLSVPWSCAMYSVWYLF